MDLIPKPDQLVAASANVAHKVLYGGLADLRPMPRTLIDEGTLREVYHYRPQGTVRESGDPVLLVTPLAAPSLCYDLRRGCSLVEHLVTGGRPTYLLEYGRVQLRDRDLGVEHWVTEAVPEAVREVSRHAGGRPVHVVGWGLGGLFALLTAAAWSSLPIGTVTTLGSPIDVSQVPMIAPVRRPFPIAWFDKLVTKPFVQLANLDDADFLAHLEAVDRFSDQMIAYPGRTFGQLYHRMIRGNELASGSLHIGGRDVSLADVDVPVLAFGGATDAIVPVGCVRPVEDLAPRVRFEVVPGGHLGMLTGRAARGTTWRILEEFLTEHASGRTAGRRTAGRPTADPVIGANPRRRFSSTSSRNLSAVAGTRGRGPA